MDLGDNNVLIGAGVVVGVSLSGFIAACIAERRGHHFTLWLWAGWLCPFVVPVLVSPLLQPINAWIYSLYGIGDMIVINVIIKSLLALIAVPLTLLFVPRSDLSQPPPSRERRIGSRIAVGLILASILLLTARLIGALSQ